MNVDFLKDGALAVAQEQHLQTVMKMIVGGINEETDIRLISQKIFVARWQKGDPVVAQF